MLRFFQVLLNFKCNFICIFYLIFTQFEITLNCIHCCFISIFIQIETFIYDLLLIIQKHLKTSKFLQFIFSMYLFLFLVFQFLIHLKFFQFFHFHSNFFLKIHLIILGNFCVELKLWKNNLFLFFYIKFLVNIFF